MAIPISKYIDIKSYTVSESVGERDFSGLVFSASVMKTTVPSEYAATKTAYDAGTAVKLTKEGIAACFDDSSVVSSFASKYFGYANVSESIYVAKVLTVSGTQETPKSAYQRVTATETNFGSFTFLGTFANGTASSGGLKEVATLNANADFLFIKATTDTTRTTDATDFGGISGCHIVMGPTPGANETNLAAWMPMAWYASANYSLANASGSIDYKDFGAEPATVTDGAKKDACDLAHVNYIGLVQVHGNGLKFYQTGVNADGMDLGAFRDRVWIKGEIEAGWFNLVGMSNKVPANGDGATMVYLMVRDVADRAIKNGAILLDKPLTSQKRAVVNSYAGVSTAATEVETSGYYTAATVEEDGERYVCKYTLVYAKGDHISKVEGGHYLV